MTGLRKRASCGSDDNLSEQLYISFVDSLLVDGKSVFFSALSVTGIEIVAAIAAKSLFLCELSTSQLIVCAIRLFFMQLHARKVPSANIEIARKQEFMFAIGAVSSLAALSLWTLAAFWVTDNGFVWLLGATMTIAYVFGMLTRNFAIYRGITMQLIAAFVPLSAALIIAGGW